MKKQVIKRGLCEKHTRARHIVKLKTNINITDAINNNDIETIEDIEDKFAKPNIQEKKIKKNKKNVEQIDSAIDSIETTLDNNE